jgi:hypothetical protein
MKVVGVGGPSWMRICLGAGELELVVDELRAQRAQATREVSGVYDHPHASDRDVDDAHDRLREVEAALMWLEQAEPEADGNTWLMAAAALLEQTVRGVAERAISVLMTEHQRFAHISHTNDGAGDGVLLLEVRT